MHIQLAGASTGSNEALELRDGDKSRYMGKGVLKAVGHVDNEIQAALKGKPVDDLKGNDDALIQADGTRLKSKLGGNSITATSFAVAEAGAFVTQTELFLHLGRWHSTANSFLSTKITKLTDKN
jgi:enolase